jgi:hypothetical protein
MESMGNDGTLPATQSDLDNLRVAVKADVNSLRADFKSLRVEVKADIDSLRADVKTDIGRLDASVRRLAMELIDVKTELREFKDVVVTKADFKRLFDAVEGFAGKTQSYDAARILHGQALTDVQVQMKDHEGRIKSLEDRPQ